VFNVNFLNISAVLVKSVVLLVGIGNGYAHTAFKR